MKERAGLGVAFDRLLDIMAAIGCALILFQVISVSVEVLIRYFFGYSFGWVTALNEWSLVYMTFAGAAWLQREGGHTSDDSIIVLLPPWVKYWAERAGWILALVTCGLLTWYGAKVTWENYTRNTYDFFKIREVPIFWIYAIIPIGSLLWLIQLLRPQSRPQSGFKSADPQNATDI